MCLYPGTAIQDYRERRLLMNHTVDVAQANKTHGVKDERTQKRVAHFPPGEGARSLWVMGVLVTYKVPSNQTGGPTHSLR